LFSESGPNFLNYVQYFQTMSKLFFQECKKFSRGLSFLCAHSSYGPVRSCDRGSFPRTCLSGSRLSWWTVAKARSGLVLTIRWLEEKRPFGHTASQGCWRLPRSPGSHVRRCFAVAPVDMLAVEVANIQTGVWERRNGRRCESRVWRFVDINDLISCDVSAQPLSS